MRQEIEKRVLLEAEYIAKTGATVRKAANVFCWGKSTIHKDVTERLYQLDKNLYHKVQKKLKINLEERHIRGGEATKKKYLSLKNKD